MPSILSSVWSGVSCGVLEIRFALTLSSFLIVALFWAQAPMLGFVTLAMAMSAVTFVLLRIVLLARYKPTRLYDLEPVDDPNDQQIGQRYTTPTCTADVTLPHLHAWSNLMSLCVCRVGAMDLTAALNLNPTHLRLAMMDRDFTPNDYELLLGLDEEMRAQQFTGIPQPLIERLPTFPVPGRKATLEDSSAPAGSAASSASSSSQPTADGDDVVCAICLELKRPGEMIRMLPCLHSFHAGDCIDQWLRHSPLCPVCKFRVHLSY